MFHRWVYRAFVDFLSGDRRKLSLLSSFVEGHQGVESPGRALAAFLLSEAYALTGDYDSAWEYFGIGSSVSSGCDLCSEVVFGSIVHSLLISRRNSELACGMLSYCMEQSIQSGCSLVSARSSLELSRVLIQRSRTYECRSLIDHSLTVFNALDERIQSARAYTTRACLFCVTGELEHARSDALKATSICRTEGVGRVRVEASLILACVLAGEGRVKEASELIGAECEDEDLLTTFPPVRDCIHAVRTSLGCGTGVGGFHESPARIVVRYLFPGVSHGPEAGSSGGGSYSGASERVSPSPAGEPVFSESVPEIHYRVEGKDGNRGGDHKRFITSHRGLLETLRELRKAAALPFPILITGESGVGKELLGRLVHKWSGRGGAPFVVFNAAAVPAELFDSTVFGHRKGAFTGAIGDNAGFVGAARDGTIFIDEVGELDPSVQAKLLRLIDLGEYVPVGDSVPRRSLARIVAASNRDLGTGGCFRRDLYHRLSVLSFHIIPLRERPGDIELLAVEFLRRLAREHGICGHGIDRDAMDVLLSYRWPGNVRELEGELLKAALRADGGIIRARHLSFEVTMGMNRSGGDLHGSASPVVRSAMGGERRVGIKARLEEIEREMILEALYREGWNVTRAALRLGLKRTTLISRMKRLGVVR